MSMLPVFFEMIAGLGTNRRERERSRACASARERARARESSIHINCTVPTDLFDFKFTFFLYRNPMLTRWKGSVEHVLQSSWEQFFCDHIAFSRNVSTLFFVLTKRTAGRQKTPFKAAFEGKREREGGGGGREGGRQRERKRERERPYWTKRLVRSCVFQRLAPGKESERKAERQIEKCARVRNTLLSVMGFRSE